MAVFAKSYLFLYYSAGKFWNKTPMCVAINAGEGPWAAAFGRFQGRSLSVVPASAGMIMSDFKSKSTITYQEFLL